MRILVSQTAVLRARFADEDGVLNTAGTVLFSVKNGAGTEIQTGTATADGTGVYKFTLNAQTQLDRLTVTWTANAPDSRVVTTYADVVGDRLAPLWRMKELTELSTKSGETRRRLADEAEEAFGRPWPMLGFPPVLEGKRLEIWLERSGSKLILPDVIYAGTIYSVTVDGTAVTVADLEVHPGWLQYKNQDEWPANKLIKVHLSHGLSPVPEDLRDAALVYARYASRDADDKISERASRIATEGADILLSPVDDDHPTGLPDVDVVIRKLRAPASAVAIV